MVESEAANFSSQITPQLSYDDASAAIEWLCRVFGFEELYRLEMPDGSIGHAELVYAGARIALASAYPEGGLGGPRALPHVHSSLQVDVEDVDAHFARAKAEGANVIQEPADQFYGDRTYRAHDLEGHRWWFHQHLRDVSPEEMANAVAEMSE